MSVGLKQIRRKNKFWGQSRHFSESFPTGLKSASDNKLCAILAFFHVHHAMNINGGLAWTLGPKEVGWGAERGIVAPHSPMHMWCLKRKKRHWLCLLLSNTADLIGGPSCPPSSSDPSPPGGKRPSRKYWGQCQQGWGWVSSHVSFSETTMSPSFGKKSTPFGETLSTPWIPSSAITVVSIPGPPWLVLMAAWVGRGLTL